MIKSRLATIIAFAFVAFSVLEAVTAGSLEDAAAQDKNALAAHDKGDYATALRLWRPVCTENLNPNVMVMESAEQ